jgi:hypothetical protein
VTVEDVQAESGFELLVPAEVETSEPPPPEVRRILREIDPTGMVIGK